MRPLALVLCPLLGAVALLGCSDDGDAGTPATTEVTPGTDQSADDAGVPECVRAQAAIGAADPPTDLVEVAAEAGRIADLAFAPDEPLASTLQAVSDAAAALTEAARGEDPAEVADAAATLSAAYDGLDEVAADLEAAECSSESWGRQVAIAAIDLVGAGG